MTKRVALVFAAMVSSCAAEPAYAVNDGPLVPYGRVTATVCWPAAAGEKPDAVDEDGRALKCRTDVLPEPLRPVILKTVAPNVSA